MARGFGSSYQQPMDRRTASMELAIRKCEAMKPFLDEAHAKLRERHEKKAKDQGKERKR